MMNSILSACLATLSLASCDVSQLRRLLPSSPDEVLPQVRPAALQPENPASAELSDGLPLPHAPHLYPVAHLERARSLREEGDLSGSLTEVRRALHDAADDVDAAERALDVLIQLARLSGHDDQGSVARRRRRKGRKCQHPDGQTRT